MYLEQEVLPAFNAWVSSLDSPVPVEHAKKHAAYFVAQHIDASRAESRGAVYDLFEEVYDYAKMKKIMEQGQLDPAQILKVDNLCNLSQGVIWAVQHDGFDAVKYNPITEWGMDISKVNKESM